MKLDFFHQHGYQVLRGVVDPGVLGEVKQFIQQEVDRILAELSDQFGVGDLPEIVRRLKLAAQSPQDVAKDSRQYQGMTGQTPLELRLSEKLWEIPRLPALRQCVTQALDSEQIYMHMPPMARFVLPGNPNAGVPAHQDISYNKHMENFVTLWVPLVTIDEACGGVAVYEGSNLAQELLDDQTQEIWLKGLSTDGYVERHCTMEMGDALLLNQWIIHQSMPNRSQTTRLSIDYRFFSQPEKTSKHLLDIQRWQVVSPAAA